MPKDKKKELNNGADINKKPPTLKIHKDFQDLGRITVEDLNEYFDIGLMATARRRRKR